MLIVSLKLAIIKSSIPMIPKLSRVSYQLTTLFLKAFQKGVIVWAFVHPAPSLCRHVNIEILDFYWLIIEYYFSVVRRWQPRTRPNFWIKRTGLNRSFHSSHVYLIFGRFFKLGFFTCTDGLLHWSMTHFNVKELFFYFK